VDGGKSAKDIVNGFSDSLPVEYYECYPPGQIRQRNIGRDLLNERTLLVGFLDDDMVLEPEALEKMIDFWNHIDVNTAGVGFNMVNSPAYSYSRLRTLLSMSNCNPGRVLSSGGNVPFQNISSDIRTQWLGGGYTVWRREILKEFPQDNLNTRWAVGEDLRFSYPIGKKYPLYVCAEAKVRHEHVYDQAPKRAVHRYQGLKQSLAVFYFVGLHKELSRAACLWMLLRSVIARFVHGCITLNPQFIEFALGRAEGILICLKSMLGYADLRKELEG
jgi:hypothetical protein